MIHRDDCPCITCKASGAGFYKTIDATLAERGSRYGVFADQAVIAQSLKDVMRAAPGWDRLAPDQKEALDMEANKNARILNGDPNFHDSWHDKVGYNKLVADRILVPKI